MSRIGRSPILVTSPVQVTITPSNEVVVKGAKATQSVKMRPQIKAKMEGNELILSRTDETQKTRALHGLYRALIQKALVLIVFGSLIYCLVGPKYVMVHMYSFNFFMPAYALLCANLVSNLVQYPSQAILRPKAFFWTTLVFVIVYPYGVFQSSRSHDIFNSVLLIVTSLMMIYKIQKHSLRPVALTALVLVAALANFSQTVNYRNEPDTEYPFCEQARHEFMKTGQPVRTKEPWTLAKNLLYCQGVPIVYE